MVITVQCPSCSTNFPVDPMKIPMGGVRVRCSVCSDIFRVARPEEASASAPAPAPSAVPAPPLAPATPLPPPASPEAPKLETPAFEHTGAHTGSAGPDPTSVDEPSTAGGIGDWVFETEPDLDAAFDVPLVEESTQERELEASVEVEMEMERDLTLVEPPAPPPPPAPEPSRPAGGFTFGKRDPSDKARRLARVLVSDMIMYNPERHERALAKGTLKEDFADEIAKSWKEYVEQVGADMARSNSFWTEALNDVLAKGERIF